MCKGSYLYTFDLDSKTMARITIKFVLESISKRGWVDIGMIQLINLELIKHLVYVVHRKRTLNSSS